MSAIEIRSATISYGREVAVSDLSLSVRSGGSLGIVGESGSGKTTVARAIVGQLGLTSGAVLLDGVELGDRRSTTERRAIQMVQQDPYSSLNPRMTVRQTLGELLRVHRIVPRSQIADRCAELMTMVRLDPADLDAFPHQFSGGQRQRIAIARAIAVQPQVIVADEPTSALDVSVQATVIELLAQLRQTLDLTLIFISHDLAVINAVCDEVAVMKSGALVETAPRETFFTAPQNAYSRALLEAVPRLDRSPGDPLT
ncbi:MAG: ATP-binding cassette protein [Frondihabitans sp.]|nr:ATP-binding cassette protein [Frondihabitans sp.]